MNLIAQSIMPMRNIQTFIAHLLWDEAEPEILRGSLRLVTKDEIVNFSSQEELIMLLQKMMSHPVVDQLPEAEGSNQFTNSSTR
jgi:hypothetical protein